ncbi:alanine--tRNA ligase [Carboxydochorda subterranea]|uniref:Alanine--tRNA ligase n=1 Tax=Carboxydichorda subterranea TaxID=3109565 RepID=A0ABZ1BZX0_9FIRM|nr:alanine--tRNA ligase [Limnochorda sp. L945t]WRP18308.1 alanine--tRNA ligase [Limnochorda sp. L945t]
MRSMTARELREAYLGFFEGKGHVRLPGSSLIPKGDPTLLLTGAGMVQFKPYFLGTAEPSYRRVTTCQRCVRTADIDRVGMTARHGTFFEMLGNFSFGDYFKREAIAWAWEFVTGVLEIDPERLWVSIYRDDDEAFDLWHREIGLSPERIVRLGKEDNFWEIGVGPCGPSSEIYIDRGPQYGCGQESCRPGCDCGRFLEFWNLVFIQYHKDEQGQYHPLKRTGIDTGMGLERMLAILQGVETIFETDEVRQILDQAAAIVGRTYGEEAHADRTIRILVDHGRSATFMAMDGIVPGNEGRGYVMRRLIRRASRYAWLMGIHEPLWARLAGAVVEAMGHAYPELAERRELILRVLESEERRFLSTLETGLSVLDQMLASRGGQAPGRIGGEEAFRLYDTYGFPLELTEEIAGERGVEVDLEGARALLEAQRERARAARRTYGYLGSGTEALAEALEGLSSEFVGYGQGRAEAVVAAVLVGGERRSLAQAGQEALVVLDRTPFYAEGGGQVADTGSLRWPGGVASVLDVQRPLADAIVHRVRVEEGRLAEGDRVEASVDWERRMRTARHHTATHLLHRALRSVLGEHATQAGSLVAPDRLRFDFNHFEALSPEQLGRIEEEINRRVLDDLPVVPVETTVEAALAQGAMALFGEKYGERVRMVDIGEGYSRELCGGTHVRRTGEVGLVHIVEETGVAAGVRRVEAVAGEAALEYLRRRERQWRQVAGKLQVGPEELVQQVERLLEQQKASQAEIERLQAKLLAQYAGRLAARAERVGSAALVVERLEGLDAPALRALGDRLREALGSCVVFLASPSDGKVLFVSMTSPELARVGVHAGEIVKAAARAAGGDGGGRPELAQAGARDLSRVDEALHAARQRAKELLALAG